LHGIVNRASETIFPCARMAGSPHSVAIGKTPEEQGPQQPQRRFHLRHQQPQLRFHLRHQQLLLLNRLRCLMENPN